MKSKDETIEFISLEEIKGTATGLGYIPIANLFIGISVPLRNEQLGDNDRCTKKAWLELQPEIRTLQLKQITSSPFDS